MAKSKITYEDKVNKFEVVDRKMQATAEDFNQIKTVINEQIIDDLNAILTKYTKNSLLEALGFLQATLSDADGDTKIEVEKAADEDSVRVTAAGVERFRIKSDGKAELYDTLLRNTTPTRIYEEEGWFRAEQSLLAACHKDAANEFWTYALHRNDGSVGTDRTKFNHSFIVRSRTVPTAGRLDNPNLENADGYAFQLIYFPRDGEGTNHGIPDHMLVQMATPNTYMAIGAPIPTDYEAGEKLGVYGNAFIQDKLRVGQIKLTNPTTNTTGSPALVYNEATDEVEVAQNTAVIQLPSPVTTYSDVIQYKIKNGRLIVFGFLATRPENTTTLLATLPIGARPNIERLATLYDVTSSEHQIITIGTNGELQASSIDVNKLYKIDIDITLTI